MGKNMNFTPSLLLLNNKHKEVWTWPSCKHPKTLSFRDSTDNSVFIPKEPLAEAEGEITVPDSSDYASMLTESENYLDKNECSSKDIIVRGVRSERLLFKPNPTSSILEIQESGGQCRPECICGQGGYFPYKESVVMVMESENPYADFKKSMEEMVDSHDLKDWGRLEELLGWYLKTNEKKNHEFILGAFVDLLAGISGGAEGTSCSDHSKASFTSDASTFPSPISSPLYQVGREKIIKEEKMVTK